MKLTALKKSADLLAAAELELNDIACEMVACGGSFDGKSVSMQYYKLDLREKELHKLIKEELTKINKQSKILLLQLQLVTLK